MPSITLTSPRGGSVVVTELADLEHYLRRNWSPTSGTAQEARTAFTGQPDHPAALESTYGSSEPTMTGTGGLIPVAALSSVTGSGTANYGADALRSWKYRQITLLVDTPVIALDFINWYPGATTDTDGPAAMTLRVGVELAGGAILPVKFASADTVTIAPGGGARSDLLYIDGKAGDVFYVRVTATMATGTTYVFTGVADPNYGYAFGPVQDNSRSGTNYAGGANPAVGPVRVLGRPTAGAVKRAVGLVGDSITQGANHDTDAYKGPFALALDTQKVPYVKIAKGGETAQAFASLAVSSRRLALIAGCTDAICQYGTNDLTTRSLALFQADLITIWQRLIRTGVRVRQTTITPRTTSTDSFATPGGQTPVAGFTVGGVRQQFNDWLRDGAPMLNGAAVATGSSAAGTLRAGATGHPLVGFIDVADAVESARNSGVWKASYTNDGIHPYGDTPRAAIAAVVPAYNASA